MAKKNRRAALLLADDPLAGDPTAKSDEEVLALSLRQSSLFSIILDRYQDAFLRKAEAVVRSREDAEDVVQETFSKIYLYGPRFKKQEGASFKSWAYKILLNTSFTHYQKRKRHWGATVELDPEFYESLPDLRSRDFEKLELSEYVISVLAKLPRDFSEALKLHFIDERPQSEVAAMEGVSVGAIKTRIHRAKKEFRKVTSGDPK